MAILRDLKKGELTIKDMSVLRENRSAKDQHKVTSGELTDYTLQHRVEMNWGYKMSDRSILPFNMRIDDRKYTLSWAELRNLDRNGFFRRERGAPRVYKLNLFDGARVIIDTQLNEEAERDMMVRFHFDDKEVILDWYQVLMLGRFV